MAINSDIPFRNILLRDSKVDKHDCLRLHVQTKEQCWIKNLIFQVVLEDTPLRSSPTAKGMLIQGHMIWKYQYLEIDILISYLSSDPNPKRFYPTWMCDSMNCMYSSFLNDSKDFEFILFAWKENTDFWILQYMKSFYLSIVPSSASLRKFPCAISKTRPLVLLKKIKKIIKKNYKYM